MVALIATAIAASAPASAQQQQKPNILVIMGDDIGYWNISAYNRGMMGYRTPNIDRIANEGAIFTDYYGQQSCTAGRAAFITGQSPLRTGLVRRVTPRQVQMARNQPYKKPIPKWLDGGPEIVLVTVSGGHRCSQTERASGRHFYFVWLHGAPKTGGSIVSKNTEAQAQVQRAARP